MSGILGDIDWLVDQIDSSLTCSADHFHSKTRKILLAGNFMWKTISLLSIIAQEKGRSLFSVVGCKPETSASVDR